MRHVELIGRVPVCGWRVCHTKYAPTIVRASRASSRAAPAPGIRSGRGPAVPLNQAIAYAVRHLERVVIQPEAHERHHESADAKRVIRRRIAVRRHVAIALVGTTTAVIGCMAPWAVPTQFFGESPGHLAMGKRTRAQRKHTEQRVHTQRTERVHRVRRVGGRVAVWKQLGARRCFAHASHGSSECRAGSERRATLEVMWRAQRPRPTGSGR